VEIFDPPPAVRQQWVEAAQSVYGKFREILSEAEQAAIQSASAKASPEKAKSQ